MSGELGERGLQRNDELVVELQPLQVHSIGQFGADAREHLQHLVEGCDPRLDQVRAGITGEDARVLAWVKRKYWEN